MTTTRKEYAAIDGFKKVELLASWLNDKKAEELLALNCTEQNSLADYIVIVTATSIRHGQGLADYILNRCRAEPIEFLRMEGYAVGEWILLDLNDVIIHIFQEDMRALYGLDNFWPTASVILDGRANV